MEIKLDDYTLNKFLIPYEPELIKSECRLC